MIITIPYNKTDAIVREMEALAKTCDNEEKVLSKYSTASDYYNEFISTVHGRQLLACMNYIPRDLPVLDIGFGTGESSIILADNGYVVSSLDPSPEFCRLLQAASHKYHFNITIYNTVAEAADEIKGFFEVVMFNSSLHHCDNPIKAINNAYKLLNKGGLLVVLNEPILPIFRTKKWFQNMMITSPVRIGHYGGNEHIYHYNEYINIIKAAGFSKVQSKLGIQYEYAGAAIMEKHRAVLYGAPIYNKSQIVRRKAWYGFVNFINDSGAIGAPLLYMLKKLSLISQVFVATK